MEFRFDANQEFQVKAIEAVADLFDGQAPVSAQVRFKQGTISLPAIDNRLDLLDHNGTRLLATASPRLRRGKQAVPLPGTPISRLALSREPIRPTAP